MTQAVPAPPLPPLRLFGDPFLRQRAKPVAQLDAATLRYCDILLAAMRVYDGVGLAGPQIGIGLRLLALGVPRPVADSPAAVAPLSPGEAFLLPRMPLVLVNPEIMDRSAATATRDEGCLSVPGLFAPVSRPVTITLHAKLADQTEFTLVCDGLLARAVQHELDHLDGILFVDRLDADALAQIKPQLRKLKRSAAKTGFLRSAPTP